MKAPAAFAAGAFAWAVVLGALYEGERIRYADSPCGASAYARTKKLHICKCNFVTERRVYLRESCRA